MEAYRRRDGGFPLVERQWVEMKHSGRKRDLNLRPDGLEDLHDDNVAQLRPLLLAAQKKLLDDVDTLKGTFLGVWSPR